MSNSQSKKTIIEGWLKKKKMETSLKFFGGFTKRWFALDIVNAILSKQSNNLRCFKPWLFK